MTNPFAILDYIWIIPALITAGVWAWALLTKSNDISTQMFWIPDPMPLVRCAIALIVTLAVWLIYFVVF